MKKSTDLKVFISTRDSTCDECREGLGRNAWITLVKEKGALCLTCADLDHLVFLPSGNAALTRRSRKHSTLSAAAKTFDKNAVRLAVIAHIRHTETNYDSLLAREYDRWDARSVVKEDVERVLEKWEMKEI